MRQVLAFPLVRSDAAYRASLVSVFLTIILSLVAALSVARGPERTRLLWGIAGVVPLIFWGGFTLVTEVLINHTTFAIVSAIFWFAKPAIFSYSLITGSFWTSASSSIGRQFLLAFQWWFWARSCWSSGCLRIGCAARVT